MNKQGGASQLRHTSLLFYDAIMCTLSDAYHTVHDISIFWSRYYHIENITITYYTSKHPQHIFLFYAKDRNYIPLLKSVLYFGGISTKNPKSISIVYFNMSRKKT